MAAGSALGFRHWWATPLIGSCGALLASAAHWPLPWIIGSLLAVTMVRCCGWMISEIPNGRISGQIVIATAIGLHFTQAVFTEVIAHFGMIASAAVMTLLLALAGIALMRRQGLDLATAYFAFMPANFAEMVRLAMDHRADVSRVATAHSVRLAVIVLCVPPLAFFIGGVEGSVEHIGPTPTGDGWHQCSLAAGLSPWRVRVSGYRTPGCSGRLDCAPA